MTANETPPWQEPPSKVFDADGKKVAVAAGSALALPGRPATVTTELSPADPAAEE